LRRRERAHCDPVARQGVWCRPRREEAPAGRVGPLDKGCEEAPTWTWRAVIASRCRGVGAQVDVFVTGDETLARRGRSLRLSAPRILLTEEWVAEVLKGSPSG
jgi:hypothetical protein